MIKGGSAHTTAFTSRREHAISYDKPMTFPPTNQTIELFISRSASFYPTASLPIKPAVGCGARAFTKAVSGDGGSSVSVEFDNRITPPLGDSLDNVP